MARALDAYTLFDSLPQADTSTQGDVPPTYDASSIEVLEGLEPVRRRPGMYIGGTDTRALHHLFSEVLDNAMDEAVAGHARDIFVTYDAEGALSIEDNGRGIPVDPHPKFPGKSALEVIMTTLHSGGKFGSGAYETSGGLHGVGVSVVNALSQRLEVEVIKAGKVFTQTFSRGVALTPLQQEFPASPPTKHSGTRVRFFPDPKIFTQGIVFSAKTLFEIVRSKAYLFSGVHIHWTCALCHLAEEPTIPPQATLHFPEGICDFLKEETKEAEPVLEEPFSAKISKPGRHGSLEWAVTWLQYAPENTLFMRSYCNTVFTPEGGTHEQAFKTAFLRALKNYAELTNNKKAQIITAEDVFCSASVVLSFFMKDPEFQGQTKEKLVSFGAIKIIDPLVRDYVDHWLSGHPTQADHLLEFFSEKAQERLSKRQERDVNRKTALKRLRLPGKLSDCSNTKAEGSEIFIVEGDSAGGSAKQARSRTNQAVLPLRGKILNVAHSAKEKIELNQQIQDLIVALGCGVGTRYRSQDLRYERVIIMTDADVDGAHIACLLMTFFYRQMPKLIEEGHLFLAVPPLYRLTQGTKSVYARSDAHRQEILKTVFSPRQKVEISRFKGLGEMMPQQLKETTMDPLKRTLLKVTFGETEEATISKVVEELMGAKSEARFSIISEKAHLFRTDDLDI